MANGVLVNCDSEFDLANIQVSWVLAAQLLTAGSTVGLTVSASGQRSLCCG